MFDCDESYKLKKLNKVGFFEPCLYKEEKVFEIHYNELGAVFIRSCFEIYSFEDTSVDLVQFKISETSDSFYFCKWVGGERSRLFWYSQGELLDGTYVGYKSKDSFVSDDFLDYIFKYLYDNFEINLHDELFQRYKSIN